ncbi:hypothetical protein I3843_05G125100 [Carya illinoinensis]|nr:hypothetical protein I3760_05G137100 [Carya illinoinensis]KAG7979320.1 hypothetical protein I3843_05G125100 [Carya illinoinensis]
MELHNIKLRVLCSTYFLVILPFSLSLLCLQSDTASSVVFQTTNETDLLALLKFKESITNDPRNILSSWNASSALHFCKWQGVSCGRKHQRVTALQLQGYSLRGSISPYVGNLSFLSSVNLQQNFLGGEIPAEVARLFRLKDLYLSNNSFTGEIPRNLTNCPELRVIDLERNELTGRIPDELGSLKRLEMLMFSSNNLTGDIPPSLRNVSSLQGLYLGDNKLWGNIPEDIGRLQRLYFFSVSSNNLSGTIPSALYNISTMSILLTDDNRLVGTLPPNIGLTLPNLQFLAMSRNKFSGPIPVSLSNSSQLEKLLLYRNNFVGQVPNLGNLLHLRWLAFHANNLGNNSSKDLDFLDSLGNCPKLEILYFSENHFGGSLPNSIGNLSMQLTQLDVAGNQISGILPAALENLTNLTFLSMAQNLLTGSIPTYFGEFQNLEGLSLDGNRFLGLIPSSIGNLTRLVTLNLSQNKLEGSIPSSFGNFKSLQELDISENSLIGAIPINILSSQLLVLNLSQNSLTGTLPVEVGNSRNIYRLDVSKNNFSGEIPRTLANCLSLEYLYLQGNSFQGNLPPSLASLKGLQYLDLSQNNLSGMIPNDLQELSVLLYLNLSFNNLAGEVPTEGIFRDASRVSVAGNKELCGGVPDLQLQPCDIKVEKKRGKSHAFKIAIIISSGIFSLTIISCCLVLYRRRKSEKKLTSTHSKSDPLSKVSYRELYQLTGGFSQNNLIGSGGFGSVYRGILPHEERMVAVKILKLQQKGASKSFIAECNVLRNIRHRNLVKILTCCSSVDYSGNEFKAIIYEYMPNGSLEKWLHPDIDNGNLSRNLNLLQRLNAAIDVASALHYLHDHCETPIVHCDLKPSNVLLDDDMIAHVSDFGLARLLSPTNHLSHHQTSTTGIKGSVGYAAPEYGMGGEASTQGDVYSYGIFVLEMFTGKKPTDENFEDSFNLHNFVKIALPEKLVQIVSPKLLTRREVDEIAASTKEDNYKYNDHDNDIEEEEEEEKEEEKSYVGEESQMNPNVQKCLLSVLQIGLACSLEPPKERMNMEDVTRQLHRIKNAFLGFGFSR